MADTENLKELLRKLKANREKVPKELLKTKYKKPYEELLHQIQREATDRMKDIALDGILILEGDTDMVEKIQASVDEEKQGIMKQISHAVFRSYDVAEFERLAGMLHTKLWNLWIPYWQEHCCLYVLPENWEEPYPPPKIYNELTKEFLVDEENNIWEKHPEWENENRTIITAGACHLLAGNAKKG